MCDNYSLVNSINECKNGEHNFIDIFTLDEGDDINKIVRWCSKCGAYRIDMDYDNGNTLEEFHQKLQTPSIISELCKNEVSLKEEKVIGVKPIPFPTFEQWFENREFICRLGAYTCRVGKFSTSQDRERIVLAISEDDNPLNVYADREFWEAITYKKGVNEEELRKWYDTVTAEANEFWRKHITFKYLISEDVMESENMG